MKLALANHHQSAASGPATYTTADVSEDGFAVIRLILAWHPQARPDLHSGKK
jgi:hypothetical protein